MLMQRATSAKVLSRGRSRRAAVSVRASIVRPPIPTPKGVSLPTTLPVVPPPQNGFVENAERLNSRAAMIGFFALIAVEAITGHGLLELVGLNIGGGLGFEL